MSINNKKAAMRTIWLIMAAIIICLFCLLLCLLFRIHDIEVYAILSLLISALTFRLITLKYFRLEISEELISFKYSHPLLENYKPADLELPWYKINVCQIEKHMLFHYICIGVSGKKRNKMFHYSLGFLSKVSIHKISDSLNSARLHYEKKTGYND